MTQEQGDNLKKLLDEWDKMTTLSMYGATMHNLVDIVRYRANRCP